MVKRVLRRSLYFVWSYLKVPTQFCQPNPKEPGFQPHLSSQFAQGPNYPSHFDLGLKNWKLSWSQNLMQEPHILGAKWSDFDTLWRRRGGHFKQLSHWLSLRDQTWSPDTVSFHSNPPSWHCQSPLWWSACPNQKWYDHSDRLDWSPGSEVQLETSDRCNCWLEWSSHSGARGMSLFGW